MSLNIPVSKGIFAAFLSVMLWAVGNVYARVAYLQWSINPVVFSCIMLFSASFVLLVIAGPGRLSAETLRQPHTWLYGLFEMLQGIISIYLVTLISPTEGSLLRRFSIPLSLGVAWLFFNRPCRRSDVIGSLITFAGMILILKGFSTPLMVSVIFLVVLGDIFNVGRTVMAEIHPASNQASTIKDRCRVTAYVLMVVSFFMVVFTMAVAVGKHVAGAAAQANPILATAPSLHDIFHLPTLLAGIACGVFLTGITRYFYLYASKEAKSENVMMMIAFTPFFTFVFEELAGALGLLNLHDISSTDILAGLIITLASLYMVYARQNKAEEG